MEILLENEFVKLTHEKEHKLLTITWTDKKVSLEEYQRPFYMALEFLSKNQVDNYISDVRNSGIIPPDYRKWLQEIAMPEAAKAGMKRVVAVANVNVFKQYYINHVFQSAKKFGMPFKMFGTVDEAKKWFKGFE